MSSAGMVVCHEPLAAEAGATVMKRGGNVFDAAIAAAFVQCVTNPTLCGIGGGGVLTYHKASTGESGCIRFWGQAGRLAGADSFTAGFRGSEGAVTGYRVDDDRNLIGYESVLVPGFVAGMDALWASHGSGDWRWEDLLEPAIRYASEGFRVGDYLGSLWAEGGLHGAPSGVRHISSNDVATEVFMPQGRTRGAGEILVQTEYSKTLSMIAKEGPSAMYAGDIAQRIHHDFDGRGFITEKDLNRYAPLSGEPLRGTYRGFELITDQPPGCGTLLVEMLNVIEGWDLAEVDPDDPRFLDRLARTMRFVFADRARYMADPRFVDVPVSQLVSRERAERTRSMVEASQEPEPLSDWAKVGGTTHLSVISPDGSAVAMTHTLGYTSGVMTRGLGFLYNNDMMGFDPRPGRRNSIAPGKSPVNGGSPTILIKDGEVRLVIGSPGGARKLTAMAQVILGVIDFGMTVSEAVSRPRIHSEDVAGTIVLEAGFSADATQDLKALGNRIQVDSYQGRVAAIWKDGKRVNAGADPRGGGGLATIRGGDS